MRAVVSVRVSGLQFREEAATEASAVVSVRVSGLQFPEEAATEDSAVVSVRVSGLQFPEEAAAEEGGAGWRPVGVRQLLPLRLRQLLIRPAVLSVIQHCRGHTQNQPVCQPGLAGGGKSVFTTGFNRLKPAGKNPWWQKSGKKSNEANTSQFNIDT